MDPSCRKIYQGTEFTAAGFYQTFLCRSTNHKLIDDLVIFPLTKVTTELTSGEVTGKSVVVFTTGPVMFKLMICCNFFETMSVLEYNADCRQELEKWLKDEPGALDWNHMTHICSEVTHRKCDLLKEKVREGLKHVVPCKLSGDRLVMDGPVPPSDCLLVLYGLESMSCSPEAYCANLRQLSLSLKLKGQLMLFGCFNGTFFRVGEQTFQIASFDEVFLRKMLKDTGFSIQILEEREREHQCDCISYDKVFYVRAVKEKEV